RPLHRGPRPVQLHRDRETGPFGSVTIFGFTLPWWLPTILPFTIAAASAKSGRGRQLRATRESNNLCPTCGYDLRATPDRCPECGTEVKKTQSDERRTKRADSLFILHSAL